MAIAFCVHHTGDVSGLIGPEKKQNAVAGGRRAAPSQARGRCEGSRRGSPPRGPWLGPPSPPRSRALGRCWPRCPGGCGARGGALYKAGPGAALTVALPPARRRSLSPDPTCFSTRCDQEVRKGCPAAHVYAQCPLSLARGICHCLFVGLF